MKYNLNAGFESKTSKAFDSNRALYEAAGDAAANELRGFRDTLHSEEPIPTKLRAKTHNSKHFLDENYLSKRKMNANTNALEELTEDLMFGSTEEDFDMELTDGGVATEIAQILADHGITGKAAIRALNKLKTFYGEDPSTEDLADEDVADEDLADEDVADEDETTEPVEESRKTLRNKRYLEARRSLRRNIAIRNLKKSFKENSGKSLKEALLVSPTGSFASKTKNGKVLAGIRKAYDNEEEEMEDWSSLGF